MDFVNFLCYSIRAGLSNGFWLYVCVCVCVSVLCSVGVLWLDAYYINACADCVGFFGMRVAREEQLLYYFATGIRAMYCVVQ